MVLISGGIKDKIINCLNEIINIQDKKWQLLDNNIKIKFIHHLCGVFNKKIQNNDIIQFDNNEDNEVDNIIKIPLKNLKPKKIIQLCGINKQSNIQIFDEFKKIFIESNREFRQKYNSKNKHYCFSNISKKNHDELISGINFNLCKFLKKNIDIINSNNLFYNLLGSNSNKIIQLPTDNIKINNINWKGNYFDIEFNNNIVINFELYLTSEKITNNIPAKYKLNLINIL